MAKDEMLTEGKLLAAWRLRELRAAAGYSTVAKAATDMGTHAAYWCVWETARQAPSKTTQKKLVELFQPRISYEIRKDIFSLPPENWATIRKEFLEKLRNRANKNKEYYELPGLEPAFDTKPVASAPFDVMFDTVLSKLTQAAQRYRNGEVSKEKYENGMERLRAIAELYF